MANIDGVKDGHQLGNETLIDVTDVRHFQEGSEVLEMQFPQTHTIAFFIKELGVVVSVGGGNPNRLNGKLKMGFGNVSENKQKLHQIFLGFNRISIHFLNILLSVFGTRWTW